MIKIKNLKYLVSAGTPQEKSVLNGIDLNIHAGEFVTLIGTNGAGKSTLLNLIAGELLPTSGSIEIADQDVTRQSGHRRADSVARVFQDPLVGTCGELSIAENMALATLRGSRRGLKSAIQSKLKRQFQEVLAGLNLGLEGRLNTPMNQLSGGQRQAVSLVMSTLSPMKVLLLDEHTSALDPRTAETVMKITDQIVTEYHLTALMVTHSMTQALQHGNRTILLHQGTVAHDLGVSERLSLSPHDLLDLYGDISSD